MDEGREKGSGDGFIMDPCLVSLVAADYHGYKPVKHGPPPFWGHPPTTDAMNEKPKTN